MNALQVMDRYGKEVIQVSTRKHDINVQYLYDKVRASDDYSSDGNYINSIIDLTGSELVLDSHSYNGLCAQSIDYNHHNK